MTIFGEFNLIFGPAANPCTYHADCKIKPYGCYSKFSLNDEEYKVGDFVIYNMKKNSEIGKLKCMFMNDDGSFYVAVESCETENIDKKSIYITEVTNILQKDDNGLSEMNSNSLFEKLKSPSLRNQTPVLNSTPTNYKDGNKEPFLDDCRSVTTPRRNSVKRNLNKSFGDLHDYSIVESTGENSLKVKLRKSRSCRITGNEESPNIRKSRRNIQRKSYTDYISPLKSRKQPVDTVHSPKFSERTSKVVRSLNLSTETPNTDVTTPSRRHSSRIRINNVEKRLTVGTAKVLRNRREISYCELENDDIGCSPIENQLNESLRTTTLRINLDKLDIKGSQKIADGCSNNGDEEICLENEKSLPSTPRSRRNRAVSVSDCYEEPCTKTPRSKRNLKLVDKASPATSSKISKTPKNRAKLIREGLITPSMQHRSKALDGDSTPLMKARSQLHVSYVPKSLPCREKEYADVYGFLQGKLLDGCGGCMYVSGVPGTGKTATVTSVITSLQEEKSIPNFTFININGMKLTEPRQSYVEIMKQLTGKNLPWEQAQSMLENIFVKSKKQKPIVMLIDELDILCTKRQDVVYNLLDWPTKAKNQLIVITIANTMDLPERLLMSRVTSRLGLTRLTFQAYTYKQLQEIVTMRLVGTDTFNPDAVQFVARKVASVSGDARRALDICRRAAEIAETEGKFELVNMTHVNEALNLMITQPKVQAIRHCSLLEKLILQSIVGEVERTGVEETNFGQVYRMLASYAAIEGFKMVSTTIAFTALARLGACRLILIDPKCNNIHQRIVLNVSADDVFYALKHD